MAISLETEKEYHESYSRDIDFQTAGHFTKYFANRLLANEMPPDVQVLKVEVPSDATPETPWQTTRLSPKSFYTPTAPKDIAEAGLKGIGYDLAPDFDQNPSGTDSHAVVNQRSVSVTPLSLDLTSRVDLQQLKDILE
jgi:5'-nucleotidase